jgi:hypothetical protein
MSKVQNPFIGRATGQAGNMVFSTNYGSNIIRSKPLTFTEPTGVEHRKKKVKFKAGAELAAKVKGIAKTLYPTNAGNIGAYAQLMRDICKAFDVVNDIAVFNPASAYIGKGITLTDTQNFTYNSVNRTLTIPTSTYQEIKRKCFPPNTIKFPFYILIFNEDLTLFYTFNALIPGGNNSYNFPIPSIFAGKKIYFSGIFLNPSESIYQIRTPLAINQLPINY